MPSRIEPIEPGESDDEEVNEILREAEEGWWGDSAMFGLIAHNPQMVKTIVPVFESFFQDGSVEPHIHELMRLKAGEINRCAYCASVRSQAVRDEVAPKEDAVFDEVEGDELNRREELAVRLSEQMSGDPNYIDDDFFDELREEYTDEEIVELVFACAVMNFGNKFNITMTLDSAEGSQYPTDLEYPLGDPEDVKVESADD